MDDGVADSGKSRLESLVSKKYREQQWWLHMRNFFDEREIFDGNLSYVEFFYISAVLYEVFDFLHSPKVHNAFRKDAVLRSIGESSFELNGGSDRTIFVVAHI